MPPKKGYMDCFSEQKGDLSSSEVLPSKIEKIDGLAFGLLMLLRVEAIAKIKIWMFIARFRGKIIS